MKKMNAKVKEKYFYTKAEANAKVKDLVFFC